MTNAELLAKIKAEIERLKATNPSEYNYQNAEGYVWALDDILSFLSTLESEKPMNQDELEKENIDVDVLDKEFHRYLKIHGLSIQKGERITYYNGDAPNLLFDLKSIVCHFYNFGCVRIAEKYNEIEYNRQRAEESPLPEDTVLFNKGVEEGKRLMMEEAVEGEVESFSDMHQEITIPLNPTMFKVGDKVRIIILPKED